MATGVLFNTQNNQIVFNPNTVHSYRKTGDVNIFTIADTIPDVSGFAFFITNLTATTVTVTPIVNVFNDGSMPDVSLSPVTVPANTSQLIPLSDLAVNYVSAILSTSAVTTGYVTGFGIIRYAYK